jgi:hypothetical protein
VYQDISERHDSRQIGDLRSQVRGGFRELIERFADNLELAFDSRAQQVICLVVL